MREEFIGNRDLTLVPVRVGDLMLNSSHEHRRSREVCVVGSSTSRTSFTIHLIHFLIYLFICSFNIYDELEIRFRGLPNCRETRGSMLSFVNGDLP